jgi:hypothetical protein
MTQKDMTNDEEVTGSENWFAIFCTFGGYVTNLRGTFVENVKKSKINPPYCTVHMVIINDTIKTYFKFTK